MEVDHDMEIEACGKPLVTVIITTYNSGATIQDVLNSLIIQDYPLKLIEIIIVDGHSVDDTVDKIKRFMEKYRDMFHNFELIIHGKNLGVSKARNDGMKLSKGKYIMILDCDVVLPPNAISRMVSFMESNLSIGSCELLLKHDSTDIITRWLYDISIRRIRKIIGCTARAMIRRDVIERAGLYDETMGPPFSVDEDLEFGARIWRSGYQCVMLGDTIAEHLGVKRDVSLAKLMGKKDEPKLTLSTYMKWLIGYLKKKQGWTWYKFLKSLPPKLRIKYVGSSLFLPCLVLLLLDLFTTPTSTNVHYTLSILLILLAVFINTFRDFVSDPANLHKSIILTFLACINRSIRSIAAFVYIITSAKQK
jgi:glycosyltransferase involved in cell wall biosynthesis